MGRENYFVQRFYSKGPYQRSCWEKTGRVSSALLPQALFLSPHYGFGGEENAEGTEESDPFWAVFGTSSEFLTIIFIRGIFSCFIMLLPLKEKYCLFFFFILQGLT